MRIPLKLLPEHTIVQYGPREKALEGMVYIKRKEVRARPSTGQRFGKQAAEEAPCSRMVTMRCVTPRASGSTS